MTLSKFGLLALAGVLVTCGVSLASGAGFKLSAVGVDLGKPDDESAEQQRLAAPDPRPELRDLV